MGGHNCLCTRLPSVHRPAAGERHRQDTTLNRGGSENAGGQRGRHLQEDHSSDELAGTCSRHFPCVLAYGGVLCYATAFGRKFHRHVGFAGRTADFRQQRLAVRGSHSHRANRRHLDRQFTPPSCPGTPVPSLDGAEEQMMQRIGRTGALSLYPLTVVLMVFILAPLAVPIAISFSDSILVSFPPKGFTLKWYAKVLTDDEFLSTFAFSLKLAAIVTLLTLALGIPCAIGLTRFEFPGRQACLGLVLSPLIFPVIVSGVALLQFVSRAGSDNAFLHLIAG